MKLSQLQIEAFQAIARLGSFTKAAHKLNLTQSALSHRIRNLEDDLATTLFIRHGSGIRLTAAGSRLLQFCRIQAQAEEEFLNELKTDETTLSGTLRVGGVSTLMRSVLIPSLGPLVRANPDIRTEIFIRELSELSHLLDSGEADYCLTTREIHKSGLESVLLGYEENVLIRPTKKTLAKDVYLDHDMEDETTSGFFNLNGKDGSFKRSFMDDIYGIIDAVAAGLGNGVVPLHLIHSRKDVMVVGGLKALRLPVRLYWSKQPYYTRLHHALIAGLESQAPEYLKLAKR